MSKTSAPRGACVRVLGMTVYSFERMETERIAYRRRALFPTWRSGPVFRSGPIAALLFGQALAQPGQDDLRDQAADVPAVPGDLLDQAGAQEGVERVGGHEERLDLGHPVVHLRHLHLVLEIADGSQPLDHRGDPVGRAEVHEQAVEPLDPDVAVTAGDLAQHLDALVDREQAVLGDVDQHRDDHLVIQARRAADDVEVTVGDRIKGTRTDYALHVVTPLLLSAVVKDLPDYCAGSSGSSGSSGPWGPGRTRTLLPRICAPYRPRTLPASSAALTWWRAPRSPGRRAPASRARRAGTGPETRRPAAGRTAGRGTPRRTGPLRRR